MLSEKVRKFRTKSIEMQKYLSSLSVMKNKDQLDLVLFSDSDAIFNFNAVTGMEVVNRFHHIVENAQSENPHKHISVDNSMVISAESSCWIGHHDCGKILPRYPVVTNGKSNCPQFVNSGGYMGTPHALLKAIDYMLSLTPADNAGGRMSSDQSLMTTFYLNHNHYKPTHAQAESRRSQKNHIEDTATVAILDRHASVFRSLYVGLFDTGNATKGTATCGMGEGSRNCGFKRGYNEYGALPSHPALEKIGSSMSIYFPAVANVNAARCLGTMSKGGSGDYLEPYPFHIHGNGKAKELLIHIQAEVNSAFSNTSTPKPINL